MIPLVAVGVGDLQEPVVLALGVHPVHDTLDHRAHAGGAITVELGDVVGMDGQRLGQVLGEDVDGRLGVEPLDLDLHVEAARPRDGRVDHVLAAGGADRRSRSQALDAVDLAEQLRDDGGL